MIDKNGTILRNLEDQVQYLTDINQLASLGFRVKGKVDNSSQLVVDDRCVNGDVMLVGTDKPYHLWVFVSTEWIDLGEFPRRGLPGIMGKKGDSIIGPRGPEGKPSNIPGPAGKNGDGLGVNYITKLDLSTGSETVAYDKTSGATLSKQGKITAAGQEYNINVTDKLPIIPGDNVDIYTNGTNNALKIGAKVPVTSVNGQKGDVVLSIPVATSDLTNDSHFITEDYHDPSKQDTLVSGQNIKTINNQSILGSGNITISGGGGGGGTDTGFDNVRDIQAADNQTTYNPDTKEYIISSGNADIFYKDGTKTTIPYVQEIGLMAGDNITFTEEFVDNANYRVKINATGGGGSSVTLPLVNLQKIAQFPYSSTFTDEQANTLENQVASAIGFTYDDGTEYHVTCYLVKYDSLHNQYKWRYEDSSVVFEIISVLSRTTGNVWAKKQFSITKSAPSSGGSTYSVVEITSSTSTLTDEQYNTLTASPFNKIKFNNEIYDLYKETSAELTYTANYFNNGYQITIKKDTKAVTTSSLSSLIAISAFVKNDLNYNQSNTRFALSAYQGKVLNDRLTAVENGGSNATLYQHTITYNSDKFNSMEDFSGENVSGSFSISFYSRHGHFENASDFWTWLIGRGSITVYDGQLWGSMGGGEAFTRITVLGNTDAEKYITFQSYGGYGEWNSIQYYLKNPAATGLTDTIIDGLRDM